MTRRTFIANRDRWTRDLTTASKSRANAILREHPASPRRRATPLPKPSPSRKDTPHD